MGDHKLSAEDVRQLYERHGPALVVYACAYTADRASAEDAVHGVFHRLLRGNTAVVDHVAGYLYRAVRNAALNAQRDNARDVALEESCFMHRSGNQVAALALQKALSELPKEQREVVVMRIWGGLSLSEAAEATGVPLNTVASRYRYALEKLRERLLASSRKEGNDENDGRNAV